MPISKSDKCLGNFCQKICCTIFFKNCPIWSHWRRGLFGGCETDGGCGNWIFPPLPGAQVSKVEQSNKSHIHFLFFKGPFPASFSLFSSFQYTVDSKQMFNINKFLPMTGFKPRTSGIGINHSTNWDTTTTLYIHFFTAGKCTIKVCTDLKLGR